MQMLGNHMYSFTRDWPFRNVKNLSILFLTLYSLQEVPLKSWDFLDKHIWIKYLSERDILKQ